MKKLLTMSLISLMLTSCFSHNYKIQDYDTYTRTSKEFTQVYLLWGIISLDGDRTLCNQNETLVYVGQNVNLWHLIFTLITGGLVDFTKIKYECGIKNVE